jgi:hypothetical protein
VPITAARLRSRCCGVKVAIAIRDAFDNAVEEIDAGAL